MTSGAPCKLDCNYLYPGLCNVEIASKTVVKLRSAGGHLRGLVSASASQVSNRSPRRQLQKGVGVMGLDQGGLDQDSIGPPPVSIMVFVPVTSKFYGESFVRTSFFLVY